MTEEIEPQETPNTSANTAGTKKSAAGKKRPKRRVLKTVIFILMMIAVMVVAAPGIIARTSLRNSLVPKFAPEYEGRLILGQTSLGWLRPISIKQLELKHPGGETWAVIKDLQGEFTLLDLILEPSQLGQWSASECDVTVHCESGTTDIEQWLDDLSEGQEGGTPSNIVFSTKSMWLTLKSTGHKSDFQLTDLKYQQNSKPEVTLVSKVDALNTNTKETAGTLDLKLDSKATTQADVAAISFPLDSLQPLFVRWGMSENISGTLDGKWKLTGNEESPVIWDGQGTVRQLAITRDQNPLLDVENLSLDLAAALSVNGWNISRLNGTTDFGEVSLEGAVHLPGSLTLNQTSFDELLKQSFAVSGQLELSQLVQRFPGLLTLQQGVELQQGTSAFRVESLPNDETPRLTASFDVQDIVASTPTRQINWAKPFTANAVIKRAENQWDIEKLNIDSKAVSLTGSGNWNSADITADVNLAEFLQEWSRIFDFGDLQLAGQVRGKATCNTTENGPIRLEATLTGTELVVGWTRDNLWRFQQIQADIKGLGDLDGNQQLQLAELSTTITTDRDQITLTQQPTLKDQSAPNWKLEGVGELTGLTGQLLASRMPGRMSGRYKLETVLIRSEKEDQFEPFDLKLTNFLYQSGGAKLQEPQLQLTGSFAINRESQTLTSDEMILNCPTIAARVNDLKLPLHDLSSTDAKLAARGRIERLWNYVEPNSTRPAPTGMLNLQLSASRQLNGTDLVWKLTADDLKWPEPIAGVPTRTVSTNNRTNIAPAWRGKASYLTANDRLSITESHISAEGLDCRLTGNIDKVSSSPFANLDGECRYDWQALRQLYPDLTGPDLILYGQHETPISLKLPLSSSPQDQSAMSGNVAVAWDRGDCNGLPIGPATITVDLTPDQMSIRPVEVTVSTGTVRFGPTINRIDQGAVLVQPAERLLNQVQLTDEICHQWLKYVSPMTADSARVSGTFSVDNSSALVVPLDQPEQINAEGLVMIHSAKMTPGPLAMQFITLGKQIDALRRGTPFDGGATDPNRPMLTITRQTVPYKVVDGRVYHKDLTMQVSNLNVTSSGSVGFDDSLDLVATIQVPDTWTVRGKKIRDIWGAAIQIPIRGSLAKPQMDSRVIKSLLDKLVRGTVTNFLENELNKQLKNLFKPK
ncbi:MAG: hypothetical protein P8M30_11770 [Planctomycetaceae bacterium]|nr:hypothetical protein [Planctomycetaceae bacterium]